MLIKTKKASTSCLWLQQKSEATLSEFKASTNKDIYANILSLHIKQKNSDCRHKKDNHFITAHMHIYKYTESQIHKSNVVSMKWKAK